MLSDNGIAFYRKAIPYNCLNFTTNEDSAIVSLNRVGFTSFGHSDGYSYVLIDLGMHFILFDDEYERIENTLTQTYFLVKEVYKDFYKKNSQRLASEK